MNKRHYVILASIVIPAIVILGSLLYLFIANKGNIVTKQQGDSGIAKTIPLTRELVVNEWNVRMKTSELIDQSYTLQDENTILFSSGNQKMLSNGCRFKNQTAGPWGIRRYKAGEPSAKNIITIGDYAYEFMAPEGGCENYKAAIQTLNNSYRSMYATLQKK